MREKPMEVLMGKRKRTSLDLPEMLDKEVQMVADEEGQTKAAYIRSCIAKALEMRRQFRVAATSLAFGTPKKLGGKSK